jgi:hypothetical protein
MFRDPDALAVALRDLVNDQHVRSALEPLGKHTSSCTCVICRARDALKKHTGIGPPPARVMWCESEA